MLWHMLAGVPNIKCKRVTKWLSELANSSEGKESIYELSKGKTISGLRSLIFKTVFRRSFPLLEINNNHMKLSTVDTFQTNAWRWLLSTWILRWPLFWCLFCILSCFWTCTTRLRIFGMLLGTKRPKRHSYREGITARGEQDQWKGTIC